MKCSWSRFAQRGLGSWIRTSEFAKLIFSWEGESYGNTQQTHPGGQPSQNIVPGQGQWSVRRHFPSCEGPTLSTSTNSLRIACPTPGHLDDSLRHPRYLTRSFDLQPIRRLTSPVSTRSWRNSGRRKAVVVNASQWIMTIAFSYRQCRSYDAAATWPARPTSGDTPCWTILLCRNSRLLAPNQRPICPL